MGHHHSIDRRTFVLGAGAALLGAAAGLGAFPQSARGAIGRYIVTSGPLRVRGWPGLSAPVVATLPQGTIVDVLAWDGAVDGHEWADVNVVGWALSGHVATAFIAPYATGDYPSGSTVYVTVDRLNLRRGPGTGYAIIGTVTYGTALVIAGEPSGGGGRIWFPVRYQSEEIIWVAGDYLTANVIAPEPSGGDFAVGDRVAVDVDAVNFRTAAGTSAGVIMVLSRGHCLEINGGPVIASGYVWYQARTLIHTVSVTGWLVEGALRHRVDEEPDPGLIWSPGGVAYVDVDRLNLREEPSLSAAVVAVMSRNAVFTITGSPIGADGYTWYPGTSASGASGWAAAEFLR